MPDLLGPWLVGVALVGQAECLSSRPLADFSSNAQFAYNKAMRAFLFGMALCGLDAAAVPSVPAEGQAVPDFQLQDQNGRAQTLHSILGPKGALLVFYRSADW